MLWISPLFLDPRYHRHHGPESTSTIILPVHIKPGYHALPVRVLAQESRIVQSTNGLELLAVQESK